MLVKGATAEPPMPWMTMFHLRRWTSICRVWSARDSAFSYNGHMIRKGRQDFSGQRVKFGTPELDALLNDVDPLLDLHQAGQRLINIIQPGWDLSHLFPHNLLDGSNAAGINSHLLILFPRLVLRSGILSGGHNSSMLGTISLQIWWRSNWH